MADKVKEYQVKALDMVGIEGGFCTGIVHPLNWRGWLSSGAYYWRDKKTGETFSKGEIKVIDYE